MEGEQPCCARFIAIWRSAASPRQRLLESTLALASAAAEHIRDNTDYTVTPSADGGTMWLPRGATRSPRRIRRSRRTTRSPVR